MRVKVRATAHPVAKEGTRRLRDKSTGRDVNSIQPGEVVELELTAYYQARIRAGELQLVADAPEPETRIKRAKE